MVKYGLNGLLTWFWLLETNTQQIWRQTPWYSQEGKSPYLAAVDVHSTYLYYFFT